MYQANKSCECGGACKIPTTNLGVNLAQGELKIQRHDGVETIIVPVILARSDVVMNNAHIPEEEFFPQAWNGTPVTVGHPKDGEDFISANTPDGLKDWHVGRIFNVFFKDGALKGEAWIEVPRARKVQPGLVEMLKANTTNMDVSTAYFHDNVVAPGELDGENFENVHTNLRPDHLALLPDEDGACSWEDGCGIRANRRTRMRKELKSAVELITNALTGSTSTAEPKVKPNARSDDDNHIQMVADMISDDKSPFVAEDEDSLRMMGSDTLKAVRNAFLKADELKTEEKPEANKAKVIKKEKTVSKEPTTMSKEDREALDFAHKIVVAERKKLEAKVTANLDIDEETVKSMDLQTLQVVANGIKELEPNADFSGRVVALTKDQKKSNEEILVNAMKSSGVVGLIESHKKKVA